MTDRFIDHVLDSVTGCVTSRVVYCFDSGHVKFITVSNTALGVLCASVFEVGSRCVYLTMHALDRQST